MTHPINCAMYKRELKYPELMLANRGTCLRIVASQQLANEMIVVKSLSYLGWGLLNQFSPFRYFPHFPLLSKQTLAIEYRVYIWQVSPQLSCGDTCQIWMWFRESNRYFCKIENFAYGEISERSFSNPHPRTASSRRLHGVGEKLRTPRRDKVQFAFHTVTDTYVPVSIPHCQWYVPRCKH